MMRRTDHLRPFPSEVQAQHQVCQNRQARQGSFSIRIPSLGTRISPSETFVLAAAVLFGPAAATVIVAINGLFCAWRARSREAHRALFNIAESALSIWNRSAKVVTFTEGQTAGVLS